MPDLGRLTGDASNCAANAGSTDGNVIVGTGIDPAGFTKGFIAKISAVPEPSSGVLLAVGLLGGVLVAGRRLKA